MSIMDDIKELSQSAPESAGKARAVLRALVERCPNPARLIELYYWSEEDDLVDLLRRYIELPEQPREALRAFLTVVADCPESVAVSVSESGDVTLSSPAVARLMNKTDAWRATTDHPEASH